ncbi:DUF5906 domain-containing protein [Vibrio splendidus]|uniref:NrS-1 polymerase-like helicase domain-containing protein n=1 Tax=Vibrio splendidus 12E03 TaxID=1191305 RepID=A0A1E5FDW8_VIBSP|nr:DUF5906 domain-containing protein [Vibrio splendidus]OEF87205.1 hypothetical protein A142_09515 [Vibrio splendidus 12E03]
MAKNARTSISCEQRKFEKAIHDAICLDMNIAFGDAKQIDLGLIQDEHYKLVTSTYVDLFEYPHARPTGQDVAKEIELQLTKSGAAKEHAARVADRVEDFHGITPNTTLITRALKELRTDTTAPTYLHEISKNTDPAVYDELLTLCRESTGATVLSEITIEIIAIINSTHSVVSHGGKTLICERVTDHKGEVTYTFSRPEEKKQLYVNLNFSYQQGEQTKKANCHVVWMGSLLRNTYHGVVFDPSGRASNRFLNIWQGFAVKPVSGDDLLDRIMWHLKHIICCGNDEHFRFLLAWMAHLIQKPEEKSGICVALKSDARGTGKSTVSRLLSRLLGQHAITVQDSKHLLGAFNSHLANKLLVTIEEAFWSGSPKDAGKIRTLITESTISIEAKGKDAIEVDSFHRFLMITNNDWVVPQTANERRFFVLEVSDEKANNRDYFKPLNADIEDEQTIGQFLNFLQDYNLSSFDLRKAPRTEATQQQVMESLEPHEEWLSGIIENGEIIDGNQSYDLECGSIVPKGSFFESYTGYCQKLSVPGHRIINEKKLGRYLIGTVNLIDGGRPTINGKRTTCYKVPLLEEMKSAFDKAYEYQ